MTFKDYLGQKHREDCPMVLDDNLPDSFDNWLTNLQADDFIKYAEEWRHKDRNQLEEDYRAQYELFCNLLDDLRTLSSTLSEREQKKIEELRLDIAQLRGNAMLAYNRTQK